MQQRTTVRILSVANLLTFAALVYVCLHDTTPAKLLQKLGWRETVVVSGQSSGKNFKYYDVKRSYFSAYKPKKVNIVMLGDSMISVVAWHELLSRNDTINRGISGDTTQGVLHRLEDIYTLAPKLCVITLGANDVKKGTPVSEITTNYEKIIRGLLAHNIVPIIQSTLYVSSRRRDFGVRNQNIKKINKFLSQYSKENSIDYVDINTALSDNGILKEEYTYDGVHLLGEAYRIWRDALLPILTKYQL